MRMVLYSLSFSLLGSISPAQAAVKVVQEGIPSSLSVILVSTRTGRTMVTGLRASSATHIVGTLTTESSATITSPIGLKDSSNPQIQFSTSATIKAYVFYRSASEQLTLNQTGGSQVGLMVNASDRVSVSETGFGSTFTVAGRIESTGGGYKFPDGSIQTTANVSGSFLQSLSSTTADYGNSNANATPDDDTIPQQSSESNICFSISITP